GSEPDQASTARAMQARAQPDAAAEPAPPSRTYPHPVEFEIEVNNQVHDVIEGELISLDHGSLKLEPVAEWVAYGKGFHVVHAPSISVALDDQAMIASAQAATAKIYVLDPAATDADARVLLTSGFVGTGQTGAARPVKRVIAGKPRTGEHLETKFGLEIETFVVPVAALKLGVIVFHEEDANLEQLDEMLASLRASTPPPRAMFQASLGPTTEEVPLVLDTATELSPNLSVTLRRRKYSLRTLGGLTFEYPRTLAVNVTDKPPLTVVTLQNERMSVQLVPMPAPIPIAQLAKTIAGRQLGEVKRTFGGRPLVGTKVQMELELTAEVYALELGGRQISVTLTYRKSDEPAAIDAATPIISSVR
ncbi:MAG: hypothetical protein WKG01_14235, partial [Kofleriaceae bacterium]